MFCYRQKKINTTIQVDIYILSIQNVIMICVSQCTQLYAGIFQLYLWLAWKHITVTSDAHISVRYM